jgi:hypothetical protein
MSALRHYPYIFLEELREITKQFNHDRRRLGEVRTGYLPNMTQKLHRLDNVARCWALKMYWGVEVKFHIFIAVELDKG